MNYMQLQSLDAQEIEMLLRAAVPEDVTDTAFAAVDWEWEVKEVYRAIQGDVLHVSNADLCAALGNNTAMSVLLAAD